MIEQKDPQTQKRSLKQDLSELAYDCSIITQEGYQSFLKHGLRPWAMPTLGRLCQEDPYKNIPEDLQDDAIGTVRGVIQQTRGIGRLAAVAQLPLGLYVAVVENPMWLIIPAVTNMLSLLYEMRRETRQERQAAVQSLEQTVEE